MTGSESAVKTIRAIVEKIVAEYAPQKIILFGSYATGTPDRDSDVDLLIIKNTDSKPRERWMAVKRILRGVAPRVPVSPLVYTEQEIAERRALKDFFIDEILTTGEVLYG